MTKQAKATFGVRFATAVVGAASSMASIWLHALWFSVWIVLNSGCAGARFVFDPFPFGFLTMVVSLEAIFLSTFCLIAQRASSADSDARELRNAQRLAEIQRILIEQNKTHRD